MVRKMCVVCFFQVAGVFFVFYKAKLFGLPLLRV